MAKCSLTVEQRLSILIQWIKGWAVAVICRSTKNVWRTTADWRWERGIFDVVTVVKIWDQFQLFGSGGLWIFKYRWRQESGGFNNSLNIIALNHKSIYGMDFKNKPNYLPRQFLKTKSRFKLTVARCCVASGISDAGPTMIAVSKRRYKHDNAD